MNAKITIVNHVLLKCITGDKKKLAHTLQKSCSEKFKQIHKKVNFDMLYFQRSARSLGGNCTLKSTLPQLLFCTVNFL